MDGETLNCACFDAYQNYGNYRTTAKTEHLEVDTQPRLTMRLRGTRHDVLASKRRDANGVLHERIRSQAKRNPGRTKGK